MITVRLEGIKEALETCDPRKVRRATRAALDRVVRSGKVAASEEIRKTYNVKKSDLDPRIRITPPRVDNLRAELEISGRPMSLSYFGARQIVGNRMVRRVNDDLRRGRIAKALRSAGPVPQGVIVEIMKGQPTYLRQAFMAKVKAGKSGSHIGVFRRLAGSTMPSRGASKGIKHRQQITEQKLITIASMAESSRVMPNVIKRIHDRWDVEFPRQLDYYLGGGR